MVTAWGDIPDTGTVPGITATHDPSISEVPFMSSVTRSASPAMQVSTELSYLLVPVGLRYLKTTVVAIYGYLILMVASIVSFLTGQDRFSWTQILAMVLICVGVYAVEIAESRGSRAPTSHLHSSPHA